MVSRGWIPGAEGVKRAIWRHPRLGWSLYRTRQHYRAVRSRLRRERAFREYLRTHAVRALHIGAFDNPLPGWLNTDVEIRRPEVAYLDATKPFPLPSNAFDYVYSEHVVEHLTYPDGLFMLRESCRVLRPGGTLRVATPSLDVLLDLFTPDKTDQQERYIRFMVDRWLPEIGKYREAMVLNNALRNWWHLFVYDRATLQDAVETAGLTDVRFYGYGESDTPMLRNLEQAGRNEGPDGRMAMRLETMALEARKPGGSSDSSAPPG